MSVRIITDSASDISQELAKEWGITVLPLSIRFEDDEYLDGVTLSGHDFYEKLAAADKLPKTSQITPYTYGVHFQEAVEAGDDVVCFTLSSGVSGSYQSALMSADDYEGRVTVIDTRQFCISELVIVERAVQLRDEGKSAAEIARTIRLEQGQAHVLAMFDTLEYLKRGGRLSSAAAFTGNLLGIKPVLTIEDGVVKVLGKARGAKRGIHMLKETVEKWEIDFDRPVCLGYTGFSDDRLREFTEEIKGILAGVREPLKTAAVGAAIGTYAGPGAIALAFFSKR